MGDSDAYIDECVRTMNKYRALHQAEPLTYNPEIGLFSKKWADHLAAKNGFEHNPNRVLNGKQLGENVAWSSNCQSGAETIDLWYNEVKDHNYRANDFAPKSGHFTQVVWKGSKEVGIWRSQRRDGTWLVVANFYPAGNYQRKFVENVLPPGDGKTCHLADKDADVYDVNQNIVTPAGKCVRSEAGGETGGSVSTTTHTETVTDSDGTKTTTVTEITKGPGPVTKTRVAETVEKPDGSKSTKISEKTERCG